MTNQEPMISIAEMRRIVANTATRDYMLSEIFNVSPESHAEGLREDIMDALSDYVQAVRR